MFASQFNRRVSRAARRAAAPAAFEPLETRQMLAATPAATAAIKPEPPAIVVYLKSQPASGKAAKNVRSPTFRFDPGTQDLLARLGIKLSEQSLQELVKTGRQMELWTDGARASSAAPNLLNGSSKSARPGQQSSKTEAHRARLGSVWFQSAPPTAQGKTLTSDNGFLVISLDGSGKSTSSIKAPDLRSLGGKAIVIKPFDFGASSQKRPGASDLGRAKPSDLVGQPRTGQAMDGSSQAETNQTASDAKTALSAVVTGLLAIAEARGLKFPKLGNAATVTDAVLGVESVAATATATKGDAYQDVKNLSSASITAVGILAGVSGEAAIAAGTGPVGLVLAGGMAYGELFNMGYEAATGETLGDTLYEASENAKGRPPSYLEQRNKIQPDPMNNDTGWVKGAASGSLAPKGPGVSDPGKDQVILVFEFNLGQQYKQKTGQVRPAGTVKPEQVKPAPESIPIGGGGTIPEKYGPDGGLSNPAGGRT